MELNCTDDQVQPEPLSTAGDNQDQDLCPSENAMSEMSEMSEDALKMFAASQETQTILITQQEHLNTSLNTSNPFILCSKTATTDKDLEQWDCCDFCQPEISLDGMSTYINNDSSTAITHAPAEVMTTAETMPDSAFNASCESDDSHAAGLFRSLSHPSNDSDSDTAVARLSDLYIFESEAHDFILSPEPNPGDIKCPQYVPLSQTEADISFRAGEVCDSSEAVTEHDQESSGSQVIVQSESDERNSVNLTPQDASDEAVSKTMRNDSPVELWLDACQYLAGEDSEESIVTAQSVMQELMSATTSDCFVPPEETQRSSYSLNACDMIGWSFDDKSWGAPVERWSSVESWESALSDWAEIIAAPEEDLTAAFTEIGAEIDALTQALAEVTTQIETELQSEKVEDVMVGSIMGVQDKPLDTWNITETSAFTGQNRLVHPESQQLSLSSCVFTSPEMSVTPRGAFEEVTDLLGIGFDSIETDASREVILNIVEDTDLECRRASKPDGDNKWDLKDEARISSLNLVAEQDNGRICTPLKTFNVTPQRNEALGVPFLSTHTVTNVHVPQGNSTHGLNVHVSPYKLEDFDGACQVPLCESPRFITPLAPLGIGSSLDSQTSSNSSLNGDQEATGWDLNRDSVYDRREALDYQSESDDVTDFSSDSTEWPNQTETDSSTDLKAGEVTQFSFIKSKSIDEEGRDLLNLAVIPYDHFFVCAEKRVACFTLDIYDPFTPLTSQTQAQKMPHKTQKSSSEGKTHLKKERLSNQPHGLHISRKKENLCNNIEAEQQSHTLKENVSREQENRLEHSEPVIETELAPQKEMARRHSKKKKKHLGKSTTEILTETENEVKTDVEKTDMCKEKLVTKSIDQTGALKKTTEKPEIKAVSKDKPALNKSAPNDNDDIIKKRRLSQNKLGKLVSALEAKFPKGDEAKVDVGATRRKPYSEVVKQKIVKPADPKVEQPIQAMSVSGDPQSLCLWCQFTDVLIDYTVTWRKDRTTLTETKRSAGDESRVSLTISNASHKDLGKYQCELSTAHKKITLDFLLTYELLSQIVVPTTPTITNTVPVEVDHEEESVHCSRLMFKEDFLAEQYFGESHSASIVTEKVHFGEGMHRRAFRTTLQAGQIPQLVTGDPCVLKVHNAITYGTKNNEELVQKNFSLAVEECQVQNTAREYIKAYTAVAQAFEAFGTVPEIIPIYLVHRPSNDIPYATLEEELIGDFVKYSVKDGKEINLMRKDSEAGQKCCAFQHWVYHYTEGNLLVTDMQGVGMRLTDVGIATCKKGYKGFKGNCATSFIDQFKALHQCNNYCEILGLKSMQPKPKKMAPAPKPKVQLGATPKKKMFEPTVKGKS